MRDLPPAPRHRQGFLFLSLEDETGIANAIVEPDLFDSLPRGAGHRAVSAGRRRPAESAGSDFRESCAAPSRWTSTPSPRPHTISAKADEMIVRDGRANHKQKPS